MNKSYIKYGALFISSMAILTMLFDIGYNQETKLLQYINYSYLIYLICIIFLIPLKYISGYITTRKPRIYILELLFWLFYIVLIITINFKDLAYRQSIDNIQPKILLFLAFTFNFIREFFGLRKNWQYKHTNPATVFVIGFALLIFGGTFLLMLPRATHSGISLIDALFTSTSAVCVTGLIVVDTGSYFTYFGQSIIMILIQLGGIGIMTFTSFFTYFFMGSSSYQSLILLGNLTNENKISEVVNTLKKILVFTFLVEITGFLLIYWNIKYDKALIQNNEFFFCAFHSISAFCNAGFSTLTNSFYEPSYRFNYWLHATIAFLFIIGGIGFPVIINIYNWLKENLITRFFNLFKRKEYIHHAHLFTLNTKLVLSTTFILLVVGTVIIYFLEYNNTLADHKGMGKIITAFFTAATPRTAGFNTIDTSAIYIPTVMFVVLLMWIGASPASTGGGIKTSTFTLAIMNIISLVRGKENIQLNRRKIPEISLSRAFAFVFLSLFFIGLIIFILLITEPEKNTTDLIFEVFSAFSTVGLSRGITGDLSSAGKVIITLSMFVGRVGALTFLSSFFRKTSVNNLQYPYEAILIN